MTGRVGSRALRGVGGGGGTVAGSGGGGGRQQRAGVGTAAAKGKGKAAVVLTRVEALDLEEELRHVREASKMTVGEILMDVRQARKGLRQVKEELERILAEKENDKNDKNDKNSAARSGVGGGVARQKNKREGDESKKNGPALRALSGAFSAQGATTASGGAGVVADSTKRLSVVSEGTERSTSSSSSSSVSASESASIPPRTGNSISTEGGGGLQVEKSSTNDGGGGSGGDAPAGVEKLSVFVEKAETRLSSIEQRASACVGLCRGLGEYFGEGADEAQSAHIFRTLVQFMDLLREAKKVEGLC